VTESKYIIKEEACDLLPQYHCDLVLFNHENLRSREIPPSEKKGNKNGGA
jgi:hypothetical protein